MVKNKITSLVAGRFDYLGVYFVSFATLMYELLLTRLFSVIVWYHFAFVAISAALFGMTVGAIGVYRFRTYISKVGERVVLARWSMYFGILIIPALLVLMFIPFGAASILFVSLPFVASGVVLALALTFFTESIGPIYGADLIGAATGCFGVIFALKFSDGPTAIFVSCFIALLGAFMFAYSTRRLIEPILLSMSLVLVIIFASLLSITSSNKHLLKMIYGKHGKEASAIYEEWNTFSRVAVYDNLSKDPFGWGLSDNCDQLRDVDQLLLQIDGDAGTILTKYDGVPSHYKFLECDVTNLADQLISGANVSVVGAGGGRDVLSSLASGANSVKAIELNDEIISAVNKRFSDYTGHLDRVKGVTFVNDEARSYLTRHTNKYDIIKISLIDTWAATAAGGYTISENSLYTTEAWQLFINRLSDKGILSVSRWRKAGVPFETYRTVSLAQDALKKIGIKDPEKHIALVLFQPTNTQYWGITNILVSRNPFDQTVLNKVQTISDKYGFKILASPNISSADPVISNLAKGNLSKAASLVPGNISPPTDNQPFFFNFIRFKDLATPFNWKYHNLSSLGLLAAMSLFVVTVVGLVFVVPYIFGKKLLNKENKALAVYFLGIGLGFMGIELGLLQRLSIFFGHPAFSIIVVLPSILAASGIGSMLSEKPIFNRLTLRRRVYLLCLILLIFVYILPKFIILGTRWGTVAHVISAMIFILPIGLLMGMPFAMGMRWASKKSNDLKPWLWGLNGAASVAGSVLAVLVSLLGGINYSFYLGILGYVITAYAAGFVSKSKK